MILILIDSYYDGSTKVEIYDDYINADKEKIKDIEEKLNTMYLKMLDELAQKSKGQI